jgi:hypothetical protein
MTLLFDVVVVQQFRCANPARQAVLPIRAD